MILVILEKLFRISMALLATAVLFPQLYIVRTRCGYGLQGILNAEVAARLTGGKLGIRIGHSGIFRFCLCRGPSFRRSRQFRAWPQQRMATCGGASTSATCVPAEPFFGGFAMSSQGPAIAAFRKSTVPEIS